jgi:hypothetical protein
MTQQKALFGIKTTPAHAGCSIIVQIFSCHSVLLTQQALSLGTLITNGEDCLIS